MASDPDFLQYITEQLSGVYGLSHRKMFGEYALYMGRKVVALVCDNQLFLKPTVAGRALLEHPTEAPPYPGAKPYLLIDAALDDRELLAELFRATEREMPEPKPKSKKTTKATKTQKIKKPGKRDPGSPKKR
ncbi:MAG TPA: TfoX/Sxy family protein [Gemmatimonadaceae bacterium]|jgi:TfoX/Sxy family transcriptional regulator of competence genes|nr:TfoX/Sxy family protein [Gemmatimonadaceae bacterium]